MTTNRLLAALTTSCSQEQLKEAAWQNATPVGDGSIWRTDCDGRYVHKQEYGLRSRYGWQIDHITPQALGGPDFPWNVRARHHLGNARAGGTLAAALTNFDK